MADSAAVQPAGNNQAEGGGAGRQQVGTWAMLKGFVIRMLVIYFVSSFFRRGSTPADTKPGGGPAGPADMTGYTPARNMFEPNSFMDVYFYINDAQKFNFETEDVDARLFWRLEDFHYGNWELGEITYEQELTLNEVQLNNGSIYLHMFVARAGWPVDPRATKYDRRNCFSRTFRLNKYKKRIYKETRNLLTGETTAEQPTTEKARNDSYEVLSFWHPNLTVNVIDDHTTWQRAGVPAMFNEFIVFDESGSTYYPIVFFNNFWNLNTDYQPINDTTPVVTLRLTLGLMSMFKWQLFVSQTQRSSWYRSMFSNEYLGDVSEIFDESDDEQDALKRTLLETNFYLLVVTVIVSLLHTVFEFLAFKNDIQFWRSRKTLEGLSVRTVLFSVFSSVIVVLYVFDNEANFLVKMSVVISLFIDVWKIKKVVNIEVYNCKLFNMDFRFLRLVDKSSYVESGTKQYDRQAFRYLSWAFFPLIVAYSIYSLLYLEHKSWFSWVISMLYGFLLTFGFIMMTPQLFINYKLKSVAHLPWRMLTYKFLNTFIDDLFAFIIHMPTLYRLGCLRDDVIFIIYLYQRWIYPIDRSRTNEFGVSGDELTDGANGQPEPIANGEQAQAVDDASSADRNDAQPSAAPDGHLKHE